MKIENEKNMIIFFSFWVGCGGGEGTFLYVRCVPFISRISSVICVVSQFAFSFLALLMLMWWNVFIISSEISNVFHTFCWRLWYTYYICMWIQARFLLYIVKPKKPKVILFKLFPLILHLHPISWLSHVFIVKTHFRSGMVFPLFFTYFLVKYVRTDPISFH